MFSSEWVSSTQCDQLVGLEQVIPQSRCSS